MAPTKDLAIVLARTHVLIEDLRIQNMGGLKPKPGAQAASLSFKVFGFWGFGIPFFFLRGGGVLEFGFQRLELVVLGFSVWRFWRKEVLGAPKEVQIAVARLTPPARIHLGCHSARWAKRPSLRWMLWS